MGRLQAQPVNKVISGAAGTQEPLGISILRVAAEEETTGAAA